MVTRWRHWNAHAAFLWRRWTRHGTWVGWKGKGGKNLSMHATGDDDAIGFSGSFVVNVKLPCSRDFELCPDRSLSLESESKGWPRNHKMSCVIVLSCAFLCTPNMPRARHRANRRIALASVCQKRHKAQGTKNRQFNTS